MCIKKYTISKNESRNDCEDFSRRPHGFSELLSRSIMDCSTLWTHRIRNFAACLLSVLAEYSHDADRSPRTTQYISTWLQFPDTRQRRHTHGHSNFVHLQPHWKTQNRGGRNVRNVKKLLICRIYITTPCFSVMASNLGDFFATVLVYFCL